MLKDYYVRGTQMILLLLKNSSKIYVMDFYGSIE